MINTVMPLTMIVRYFRLPPFIFSSADVLPPLSAGKYCQSIKNQKTFHNGTFFDSLCFKMKHQPGA
jgi:hypothetical protein